MVVLSKERIPQEISQNTSPDLLPDGYCFMFSTHDYFSKRLMFQNITSLSPIDLGSIFHPQLDGLETQSRICTQGLLSKIQLIFTKSDELSMVKVNDLIDYWLHVTQIWNKNGFSSIFVENMMNFLNKKSVVIDDSVFLISTTISEGQKNISHSNGQELKLENSHEKNQSFKKSNALQIE